MNPASGVANGDELLKLAKGSVPVKAGTSGLGSPMFIKATLHYTLQQDPNKRIADVGNLPLWKQTQ